MELNQQNIQTELHNLEEGKKVIFKNNKGKIKIFRLKNDYYYITFNGNEIETIKDIEAVYKTIIDILEISE